MEEVQGVRALRQRCRLGTLNSRCGGNSEHSHAAIARSRHMRWSVRRLFRHNLGICGARPGRRCRARAFCPALCSATFHPRIAPQMSAPRIGFQVPRSLPSLGIPRVAMGSARLWRYCMASICVSAAAHLSRTCRAEQEREYRFDPTNSGMARSVERVPAPTVLDGIVWGAAHAMARRAIAPS